MLEGLRIGKAENYTNDRVLACCNMHQMSLSSC